MDHILHVKDIKKLLEEGERIKAVSAIDHLLELGPSNIEALTIKAYLLEQEGKFSLERKVWEKIMRIDPENMEAIRYFEQQFLEETEIFYFTDELPRGGRKFIVHPRALIHASLVGLFGCLLFLIYSNFSRHFLFLALPAFSLGSFLLLVIAPWFLIIYNYFTACKEIHLTDEGISLHTRLKKEFILWKDVGQVSMASHGNEHGRFLSLMMVPKDIQKPIWEFDLTYESSVIKARSYFIRLVEDFFGAEVTYIQKELLPNSKLPSISI